MDGRDVETSDVADGLDDIFCSVCCQTFKSARGLELVSVVAV